MASTRKSPTSSTLLARVTVVLKQHVQRGDRLVAALSGGVDSVVLFDLLRRVSKKLHFELAALHVNHQINPAAARWAAFCRALCKERGIKCTVVRVTVPRGNSLEAAARVARYRAFAALPANFIALAHNLDDQAETVLLQLLRGAGVKGLSAMPVIRIQDSGVRIQRPKIKKSQQAGKNTIPNPESRILHPAILRPLLDVPRNEIVAYAHRRKLKWIEDDSNADPGFDRNFLRHQVLPMIAQRYPAYRKTLFRASRNFSEASALLDELAASDAVLTADGLSLTGLRRLSAARAKNAVRFFLGVHGVVMPNAARLDECVRQILHASPRARMALNLGNHSLLRYADELRLVVKSGVSPAGYSCAWRGESALALSELGGILKMKKCRSAGISLERLRAAPVTVRVRQGGERFQTDARRPRRSLKNLLQEACIAPWLRARLPLVFSGSALVCVPGIGIDPAYRAARGEPGIEPIWEVQ